MALLGRLFDAIVLAMTEKSPPKMAAISWDMWLYVFAVTNMAAMTKAQKAAAKILAKQGLANKAEAEAEAAAVAAVCFTGCQSGFHAGDSARRQSRAVYTAADLMPCVVFALVACRPLPRRPPPLPLPLLPETRALQLKRGKWWRTLHATPMVFWRLVKHPRISKLYSALIHTSVLVVLL